VAADSPFGQLDFLYMPSHDVAADVRYFTDVLGARPVFAIDAMGTRVAMVALTDDPPHVLLAGHVEGDAPILVYRVPDLDVALATLELRGFSDGRRLELPVGPACSFNAPGGQRIAIYERTRAEVEQHFYGRLDF
jgi:hypothetical protein